MKKYVIITALGLLIILSFTFYKYRAQDLGDVINIEQVDRMLLTTAERERELEGVEREIPKVNEEQINQLAEFLNQYQVRLTVKEGWFSEHPSEQFTLFLVYKNGETEIFTFERDVVAFTRVYEVVNGPLDDKWLQEIERELNSN